MDPAIGTLLGAVVGGLASLGGVGLMQRHQNRRELVKAAAELALLDFQEKRDPRMNPMTPLAVYMAYNMEVLKAIADGELTEADVRRLDSKKMSLVAAFNKAWNK